LIENQTKGKPRLREQTGLFLSSDAVKSCQNNTDIIFLRSGIELLIPGYFEYIYGCGFYTPLAGFFSLTDTTDDKQLLLLGK